MTGIVMQLLPRRGNTLGDHDARGRQRRPLWPGPVRGTGSGDARTSDIREERPNRTRWGREILRHGDRGQSCRPHGARRQLLLPARPVRMRQDVDPENDRRPRGDQRDLGITFVHWTHSQQAAMSVADTVVVMDHGRIEQVGPPRTIYNAPATSFVARFIGGHNVLEGRLESASADGFRLRLAAGSVVSGAGGAAGPGRDTASGAVRSDLVRIHGGRSDPLPDNAIPSLVSAVAQARGGPVGRRGRKRRD